MTRFLTSFCLVFLAMLMLASPARATVGKTARVASPPVRQDVLLRHRLSGPALDTLTTLVVRFNNEQKGRARVVMQDARQLDEAGLKQYPTIALLEPDDGMQFFQGMPRFKPLFQVMALAGEKLEARHFLPLMADAADDGAGRVQSLPLGFSLPVLLWNKDALQKAGLDDEAEPKTWLDVQKIAGALYDAGSQCPVTSSRFAWIHLENVSTQHGEPLAMPAKGARPRIYLNSMVDIKHLALLSSWYKAHYFRYFGPGNEADNRFLAGECAMMTGESALYHEATGNGMKVGMSQMPFYDDMYGANREKILPGGLGLWALSGRKKEEYLVVATFARFMLRPEIQAEWLRGTGFLPMTPGALNAMKTAGVPLPLVDLASRRLNQPSPARARTKHNFGLAHLRAILGEEIATVWANLKPAKEALDTAMRRANAAPLYTDEPGARH